MTDRPHPSLLCPSCRVPLTMSERQSVEIDYCPQCRGIWLDRGELDKILERAAGEVQPPQAPSQPWQQSPPPYDDWRDDRRSQKGQGYPKRKKSFLEELFD